MSQSEEDKFKEEWRSAFDDAADTPPDRVWDAIARQLDEEEQSAVVPLWASPWTRFRPWAYGAAAAVIAIVMGWWAVRSINQVESSQVAADRPRQSAPVAPGKTGNQIPATEPSNPDAQGYAAANEASATHAGGATLSPNAARRFSPMHSSQSPVGVVAKQQVAVNQRVATARSSTPISAADLTRSDLPVSLVPQKEAIDAILLETNDQRLVYEANRLKGKAMNSKRMALNRVVWYRMPESTTAEPQIRKHPKRELWASLSATTTSFNPMASVGQLNNTQVYSIANNGVQTAQMRQNGSQIENRPQISMAWQAGGGVKLSKHWSVETGIQYLDGRSQARSTTSMANVFTNQSENVLANAVRNSSPLVSSNAVRDMSAVVDKNASLVNPQFTTAVAAEELVSNNFQYMQVPIQLGYHIQPGRKMNYAVLGGLVTNVFLQNTIDGSLEVRPDDQVYRPVLLAGSAGLRVNYQPTEHWSGSVTGSYQQALQNGTRSTAQLRTRPQSVGVGVGMNYHF